MKKLDIFLIVALFILFIAIWGWQRNQPDLAGDFASVNVDGREIARIDLHEDRQYIFQGDQFPFTVECLQGAVRISQSPCKNQICVQTGWIETDQQNIVCLPNKAIITIEKKEQRYQTITQ